MTVHILGSSMRKFNFSYLLNSTILSAFLLSGAASAANGYIVDKGVPIIFNATLQSIDSPNTMVATFEGSEHYLNVLEKAGLGRSNYGKIRDGSMLIRIGIAGTPEINFSSSDSKKIIDNLKKETFKLTCYKIGNFHKIDFIPICHAENKSKVSLIELLNQIVPKYLPLDYVSLSGVDELEQLIKKIEKKLIISDFM
jgi:hypothetical protein